MKTTAKFLLSLLFPMLAALPLLAEEPQSYHYLGRFTVTAAGMTLESLIRVAEPLPRLRVDPLTLPHDFRFTLLDGAGKTLHRGAFKDPRVVSAELAGSGGEAEQHIRIQRPEGALLLRLPPYAKGVKLVVEKRLSVPIETLRREEGLAVKTEEYQPFATLELPLDVPSAVQTPRTPQTPEGAAVKPAVKTDTPETRPGK